MKNSLHTLDIANPWSRVGFGAPRVLWAQRQPIPGAVIPPGHSKYALVKFSTQDNLYVVAEDVNATTPSGGWALGEIITYRSGGRTYSIEAHSGIAISASTGPDSGCDASSKAFDKAIFHQTTSG
jgi:hypothetical protein